MTKSYPGDADDRQDDTQFPGPAPQVGVGAGVFASRSAVVAAAIEHMMRDELERDVALAALAEEIRARMRTTRSAYVDGERTFSAAREIVAAAREG